MKQSIELNQSITLEDVNHLVGKRVRIIFDKRKQNKVKYRTNEVSRHSLVCNLLCIKDKIITLTQEDDDKPPQEDDDKPLEIHVKIKDVIEINEILFGGY